MADLRLYLFECMKAIFRYEEPRFGVLWHYRGRSVCRSLGAGSYFDRRLTT
jgi:hypothetical protein